MSVTLLDSGYAKLEYIGHEPLTESDRRYTGRIRDKPSPAISVPASTPVQYIGRWNLLGKKRECNRKMSKKVIRYSLK